MCLHFTTLVFGFLVRAVVTIYRSVFVQYVTTCDQVTLRIFLFTPVSPVSSSENRHIRFFIEVLPFPFFIVELLSSHSSNLSSHNDCKQNICIQEIALSQCAFLQRMATSPQMEDTEKKWPLPRSILTHKYVQARHTGAHIH